MKTIAFALDLQDDPEKIAEYKNYHKHVWPEVLASIEKSGVRKSKIFLIGNRLFMIQEVDDNYQPDDVQSYTSGAREQEWDALMRTFQKQVPWAKPGEWWAAMEEVYDLEDQLAQRAEH